MKAYCIFDDFGIEASTLLINAGVDLTVHPMGKPRPNQEEMKLILEKYDCVIIGTSQKITNNMFENISTHRIIATASVGLDHISIPPEKKKYVEIIRTPKANAQSVAEYTIGCALLCSKRLVEGNNLYLDGKDNKALKKKPEDLFGKTLGVIGAGNVSACIMRYARFFGMNIMCWTPHPERHMELAEIGVIFEELNSVIKYADVLSINLPNVEETYNLISKERISLMKTDAIFISVSRKEVLNVEALINKACEYPNFYVCLDLDIEDSIIKYLPSQNNILVTPHIAGGTIETRKRMFVEIAQQIAKSL